jgi:hypothetical protein
MSASEKLEQIGRLVEELNALKEKQAYVSEKLSRTKSAYQVASQQFVNLRVHADHVVYPSGPNLLPVEHLLDDRQLLEAFQERDRLNAEIREVLDRLKPLAPHLF